MICPVCGSNNSDANSFCEVCGTYLSVQNHGEQSYDAKHDSVVKKPWFWIIVLMIVLIVAGLIVFLVLHADSKAENTGNGDSYEYSSSKTVSEDENKTVDFALSVAESTTQTNVIQQQPTQPKNDGSSQYYALSSMTDSTGTTYYNWNGLTLTITTPSGKITVVQYNSDGSIRNRTVNGKTQMIRTGPDPACVYEGDDGSCCKTTFDASGNVVLQEFFLENITDHVNSNYVIPLHAIRYEAKGVGVDRCVDYYYDSDNRLIKSVLTENLTGVVTTTEYSYDSYGNMVRENWSDNSKSGAINYKYSSVTKAQFDVYIQSECLKDINARYNIYTNTFMPDV